MRTDLPYAGFWIRAAARTLDLLIILLIYNIFYLAYRLGADAGFWPSLAFGEGAANGFSMAGVVVGVFFFGFPIFYFTYLQGSCGQTFGKMALKLKVVNEDGSDLDYRKAFRRWLVEFALSFILGFLLLMALLLVASAVEFLLAKASNVYSAIRYLQSVFDWVLGLVVLFLVTVPSGLIFLWAAFDIRKQGLHDKICRTVVIRLDRPARVAGRTVSAGVPPGDRSAEPGPEPPTPLTE